MLKPFATDPNRARMEAFAGLTLTAALRSGGAGAASRTFGGYPRGWAGYHEHLVLIAED